MKRIKQTKKRLPFKNVILFAIVAISGVFLVHTHTVNAATYTVTNTNDSGAGSLRQALIDANTNPGADTINFNIPGAGVHTISLLSPFSSVDGSQLGDGFPGSATNPHNPVIINGCSQPGSDCSQFPLSLKIQVDGSNISAAADSAGGKGAIFNPFGAGSSVKGLSITGGIAKGYAAFAQYRVTADSAFVSTGGLTLQSNYIGLNPDGTSNGNTSAMSAGTNSIKMFPIKIGGSNPGEGNVIGGNSVSGVSSQVGAPFATTPTLSDFVVEGNYFGLDPTGTIARPNGGPTIAANNAYQDPAIGTPGVIIRNNKIANAGTFGVQLYMSGGVLVDNNQITNSGTAGIFVTGKAPTRATPAPAIVQTPITIQNNTITGTGAGPGVAVTDVSASARPTWITIRHNSIYGNSGLGVDLANNGVTANDNLDPDAGPNTLTNFPTLVSAGGGIVYGTYNGIANQTFTIDLYTNTAADPSGNGEGQTWVGSTTITTDANGNATFGPVATTAAATNLGTKTATLNGGVLDWLTQAIPAGSYLTATATDSNGNTSEFSNAVQATSTMDQSAYDVNFRYRLAGSSDPWIYTTDQGMNYPSSYNAAIGGLTPGTSYEYQTVVTGTTGQVYGALQTFSTLVDSDNDGIPNSIEDAAPNGGDANNDGIQDSLQAYVGSFVSSVSGKYVSLELDPACQIDAASINTEASNTTQDQNFTYPVGMLGFTADCGTPGMTTAVTQYYFGVTGSYTLRKYNPTTNTYFGINDATFAQLTIGGESATKTVFSIVDGSERDSGGTADGTIVDPAGLAVSTVAVPNAPNTGVPQGMTWVYILIGSLIALVSARLIRTKFINS